MGKSKNRPKREQKSKGKNVQSESTFRHRDRKIGRRQSSPFRYYPTGTSQAKGPKNKTKGITYFSSKPVKITIDSEMNDLIGGSFGNRPWQ